MKLYTCQQGTEEWAALRIGIPTASQFHRILTPKTMKPSASARGYLYELCAEWLLGMALDGGSSAFMDRGTGLEPQARAWYAFHREVDVQKVGFATTDDGLAGASADGLVGDDGGIEIKCKSIVEHVAALQEPADESEHRAQVQGGMLIYERLWWDRVYYHPSLPSLVVRIERDDDYIARFAPALAAFTEQLRSARQRLLDIGCTPHVPEPRQPMPEWNPEWNEGGKPRIVDAVDAAIEAQAPPASYVFDAAEFDEEKF